MGMKAGLFLAAGLLPSLGVAAPIRPERQYGTCRKTTVAIMYNNVMSII